MHVDCEFKFILKIPKQLFIEYSACNPKAMLAHSASFIMEIESFSVDMFSLILIHLDILTTFLGAVLPRRVWGVARFPSRRLSLESSSSAGHSLSIPCQFPCRFPWQCPCQFLVNAIVIPLWMSLSIPLLMSLSIPIYNITLTYKTSLLQVALLPAPADPCQGSSPTLPKGAR